MRTELMGLSKQSDPLVFTRAQIEWLLDHIGNEDGAIRDDLVYQLFARGFCSGGFNDEQKRFIAARATASAGLFTHIGERNGYFVYTRTFTALLGQLLLATDADDSFLTPQQLQTWLTWAIRYLQEENDWRGFVSGHGWAHAIAHGSDLLSAAVAHPAMTMDQLAQSLAVVANVLQRQQAPFLDDEEERLAMIIIEAARNHHYPRAAVTDFIKTTDEQLRQANDDALPTYYRLSAWKRVLQTIYFLEPTLQSVIEPLMTQYYQRNGYI
jgi:hypothetical protein